MSTKLSGIRVGMILILGWPVGLAGQVDSLVQPLASTTAQKIDGNLVDQLPVDRLGQAFRLLPGVGPAREAGLSIRGGRSSDIATYLDGVPLTPGYRKTRLAFLPYDIPAPGQSFLEVGTNVVTELEVLSGPLTPIFGGGQSGILRISTLMPTRRLEARGGYESDRPFGSLHGPGLDRLQGTLGSRLSSRILLTAAVVVEGYRSAESGPGVEAVPVLVPAGIDTTVAVPSALNDPLADTTFVDISRFALARGRCEEFAGSLNPDIADNYGRDCQGIRLPGSGSSNYQLLGKIRYEIRPGSQLWLSGTASRDQARLFDFRFLNLPQNQSGQKTSSRVLTLGAFHRLPFAGRPLTVTAALSLQRDRSVAGLLTPSSERETRDGFLLQELDFLWDFDSFPVDEELISNIRNNVPGSRRSPLDLENVDQYSLIDQYRNSPYGLGGGPESGGPSGRLQLLKENRTVVTGSVTWRLNPIHTVQAGLELTRYSLAGYASSLNTMIYSDAFLAEPVQTGLYLEDRVRSGNLQIVGGVRYDRFRSDARRPFVLDTVSTSAHFNTYSYFPTPSSYGGGATFNGLPLVTLVPDAARSALSPRIQLAFAARKATIVRVGFARQNQMPDLGQVLSGVNTDLRVTNTSHVYGGDLELERSTIYELGVRHQIFPALGIDLSGYIRELDDQAIPALVPYRDPARNGAQVDLLQLTSEGEGRVRGVDVRLDGRHGLLTGMLGYAYQKADRRFTSFPGGENTRIPLEDSRPHTVTGIVAASLPRDWRADLLGTLLQETGMYATFRYSSGTPYTRCLDVSALAGEPCLFGFDGDFQGERLPSVKQLDLRATRTFHIGRRQLVAYLDGRNVLDFRNALSVYAWTGRTSSPLEAAEVFSQDSAGFARVGAVNGILGGNSELDLRYGGAAAGGCGNFLNSISGPAAPDCVYLVRAEERFGDGDHVFTLAEQRRASEAAYRVVRGGDTFLGPPRRFRLGLEVRF